MSIETLCRWLPRCWKVEWRGEERSWKKDADSGLVCTITALQVYLPKGVRMMHVVHVVLWYRLKVGTCKNNFFNFDVSDEFKCGFQKVSSSLSSSSLSSCLYFLFFFLFFFFFANNNCTVSFNFNISSRALRSLSW